jgi:amidophosphoribosyltransferase
VRYPNVYGIDMPSASELVAHGRTELEVQERIGADRLIFQDLDDLIDAVRKKGKSEAEQFDTSVFSGHYVTGDVSHQYLEQLELLRNDSAKQEREITSNNVIGLHNQP